MTPMTIDEYRVIKELGRGSYGVTYRVEKAGEELALKLLLVNAEAGGKERFQNEVWALEQLDHPALPKLRAKGMHEDRPFFVMTLARGRSLRKLYEEQVQHGGAIGQVRMLEIAFAVLDALAHMHSKEIYHRDVKDDNI